MHLLSFKKNIRTIVIFNSSDFQTITVPYIVNYNFCYFLLDAGPIAPAFS